jgi:hypothetical protein
MLGYLKAQQYYSFRSCQLKMDEIVKSGLPAVSLIVEETLFQLDQGLKTLWERFVTAINSNRPTFKIVLAPLKKQWDYSRNSSHN